jgi:uncharacterized protein YcbK (DUF882 family)
MLVATISSEALRTSRRRFLACAGTVLAGASLSPRTVLAAATERRLSFAHTHTGERLSIAYADAVNYRPTALTSINGLLRDFRTNEIHPIDPALLDLLHELATCTGTSEPFHVISGYRSARTNIMLRLRGGGGVAAHSLHMEGRAIDIRLPDVKLAVLREAAMDLKQGGVGFYPASNFVHVDTGRVRRW